MIGWKNVRTCVFVVLGAAALAGCSGTIASLEPALSEAPKETKSASAGRQMIGKPYKVGGRWYHPREDKDYNKVGKASWYGPKFHGRRTANGERFNQNAMTAAHPTLPLPSYVRVTNVRSGKAVVLRVNDRGPFARGRIIDVSKAAATKLGFRSAGHAKVRVEYLGPAPVGGGDRETQVAAAKYGTSSQAEGGLSIGKLNPFRRGERPAEEAADAPVKVRLAATESRPVRTASTLPGVTRTASRRAVEPPREEPAAAVAYSEPTTPSKESGAIDAVIALNAEEEPAPTAPAQAAPQPTKPLPAVAVEASDSRVSSAHDVFAAIDSTANGAGELRGTAPAQ
ncbi:MAG: septal ring lytic transglycosylase RlpA family protein [Pseudomonadota bacterium]